MRKNYYKKTICLLVAIMLFSGGMWAQLPYFEDFENAGVIPNGWTQERVSGEVDWSFKAGGEFPLERSAHSGSYNAEIHGFGYTTRLISPLLDLSSASEVKLIFWLSQREFFGNDKLSIKYRKNTSDSWTLIPGAEYLKDIWGWELQQLYLPDLSATYQIAFEVEGDDNPGILIDDVTIKVPDVTTWNEGSWIPNPPDITSDAIIDDNYTDGNITCYNLTINSGNVLTIGNGVEVESVGTLINNAGVNGLIIEDGGSLKHNTADVPATVKKNMQGGLLSSATNGITNYWNMMSTPVASFPVENTFRSDWVYNYNTLGTTPETAWEDLKEGDTFEAMNGYLVYTSNTSKEAIFKGNLNEGDLAYTISGGSESYHLVGNPYPSSIDFSEVRSSNYDINDYFAYWDNSSVSYHYFDRHSFVPSTMTSEIPAGQAFFVQMEYIFEWKSKASKQVIFNNSMRKHPTERFLEGEGDFKKSDYKISNIRFQLSNSNHSSENLIYFSEEGEDVESLGTMVDYVPLVYTLSGDKKLVMKHQTKAKGSQMFNIGMYIPKADKYSLKAFDFAELDNKVTLTLEDTKTGTMTDLRKESLYSFTVEESDLVLGNEINNRFILHLNALPTGISHVSESTINIYSNESIIYLSGEELQTVQVFDLSGKILVSKQLSASLGATPTMVEAPAKGVLLVKVTSESGVKTEKVFIK